MKSNVRVFLKIMEAVYYDATMKCPVDISDFRDLDYIRSRVKGEGVSFLTITLPEFCKDFEYCLSQGSIGSKHFRSFRKCRSIPSFLKGMISRIFDTDTGRILNESESAYFEAVPLIVESVRQICLTFKKVELPCAPHRERAALLNFIKVEQTFSDFQVRGEDFTTFCSVSSCLWDNLVGSLDPLDFSYRHGPGATSEKVHGNQKFLWKFWHERLENFLPFFGNAVPLGTVSEDGYQDVSFLKEHEELPVRVTPVPKTLKGPRIIAIEPSCMQFAQQGIRGALYDAIESNWMTRGHVNFRDQSINQSLAMSASKYKDFATLDLSDASDRVPLDLSLIMLSSNEFLMEFVEACRSRTALMPDGTTIGPLSKFASMGSALCFPIEAMYFYTICVIALLEFHGLPVDVTSCYKVSRDIYVYGDDIIVPVAAAGTVVDFLQRYNCKVNTSKSFVEGNFRESCGVDAYLGYDVTPTYVRQDVPNNRQQVSSLISYVETGNHFYKRGYWRTAQLIFNLVERTLGELPYVSEHSGALGRFSYMGYRSYHRWSKRYHRLEIQAWVPCPVYRTDVLDGYAALNKSLSINGELVDRHHLERSALHGEASLKRRWVSATFG